MSKQTIIRNDNDRYNYVMGEPYIQNEHFTEGYFTYRIQGVDLEHFAYRVWVTNDVYCDVILVSCPYMKDFIKNEKINRALFIDDSGIGLENLEH